MSQTLVLDLKSFTTSSAREVVAAIRGLRFFWNLVVTARSTPNAPAIRIRLFERIQNGPVVIRSQDGWSWQTPKAPEWMTPVQAARFRADRVNHTLQELEGVAKWLVLATRGAMQPLPKYRASEWPWIGQLIDEIRQEQQQIATGPEAALVTAALDSIQSMPVAPIVPVIPEAVPEMIAEPEIVIPTDPLPADCAALYHEAVLAKFDHVAETFGPHGRVVSFDHSDGSERRWHRSEIPTGVAELIDWSKNLKPQNLKVNQQQRKRLERSVQSFDQTIGRCLDAYIASAKKQMAGV